MVLDRGVRMKPLNLKEIALKEEMKERCLTKGQYIDENAKKKFDMLCHLEDFEIKYWELQEENKKYKEVFEKAINFIDNYMYENYCYVGSEDRLKDILKEVE